MVSIIIPFKDSADLLSKCVSSILKKTSYQNYEILLVDNGSKEEKTKEYLKSIENNKKVKILQYDRPFNFSAINNFAAKEAKGEYLLFLNNDTEVISENWIEEMLKCFEDEKVGAVGARLLYPNETIQHNGVMLEKERLAIHAFRMWKEENVLINEDASGWSAVTAACMMTRKDLFLERDGFDEKNLPIAYNDVDYCLRLRESGYKILCAQNAKLYHYESASRKSDVLAKIFNRKRYKQFLFEQEYMRKKWKKEIESDPFYDKKYV